MKNYKKYLPTKKFSIIMGSVVVVLSLAFGAFYYFSKKESFEKEKNDLLVENSLVESQTIIELIESDSDNDGVLDWEEALWGTDKNKKATFDGKSDSAYIADKKRELNIETDLNNEKNLSETDLFAREFFSAYTALKASGQVDSDVINNFSDALGQKIANPNLIDLYNKEDVKYTNSDSESTRASYYNTLKQAFEKESAYGIGDELNIVSGGLFEYANSGTEEKYENLKVISTAYKEFAKKVIETPVPESLFEIHLQIANNAYNTGISVENLTKITADPIVGIAGLTQYEKYSEALIQAVDNLEATFER